MSQTLTQSRDVPPQRTSALAQRLAGFVDSESAAGYRRSAVVLAVLVPLLGLALVAAGAPPVAGPWNLMVLLDAGWRIVNGQVPHTDFHTPVGPLTYLLVAAGMKLGGAKTNSVTWGVVLFTVMLAPVAWHIASKRLPWAWSSVLVIFLTVFMLSPRPLGYQIKETTYGMIYNREGYLLLVIFLIGVFLKPRDPSRRTAVLEGALFGVLFALLLYCKITYFVVAGALGLVAIVLRPPPLRWFLALAAASLAVCGLTFLVFHVRLVSYLGDLAVAGGSQTSGLRIRLLATAVENNGTWIYLLTVCVALWLWVERRSGGLTFETMRGPLAFAAIVGGALLINVGNSSQKGAADDPLYLVAAIVLLETLRRRIREPSGSDAGLNLVRVASMTLLLPIFCGTIFARDLASYAYAIAWNVLRRPAYDESRRIRSDSLADFYVPPSTDRMTAYWPAREHPEKINDGIDLLRRNLRPGDQVTAMALMNPFSFALGLKPPHDGELWWDLNMSFSMRHFPPPEEFLGEASIVMVPRYTSHFPDLEFDTVQALFFLYEEYLSTNFAERDSTGTWVLYRRRSQLP
jgi:hypothetical protein